MSDEKDTTEPQTETSAPKVEIKITDYKGIVRGPSIVEFEGRYAVDLGLIDSPALATGINVSVNKMALELKQLKSLVEWAVQFQHAFSEYAEKVGICDCPICQAKAYVDEKLGEAKPGQPKLGVGIGGHYL